MSKAELSRKQLFNENDGKSTIFSYLYHKRKLMAKLFPHCGERGYAFSRFVQGQKLRLVDMLALKRI